MNLTIITPCSRPENLQKVKESITITCTWIIVYDSERPIEQFSDEKWIIETNVKGGISGNLQRNLAFDYVELNDWVYFLDDDNLLHPDFYKLCIFPQRSMGYIFGQDLGNGQLRIPNKDNIKVGHIDQAQYLLHMSLIGKSRFLQVYEADGYFIQDIYRKHSNEINISEAVLSYYNKLKI